MTDLVIECCSLFSPWLLVSSYLFHHCVFIHADPSLGRSSNYFPIRIWLRDSGGLLEPPCSVSNQQVRPPWEFPWKLLIFHPWAGCQFQEERALFLSLSPASGTEPVSIIIGGWKDEWILLYPPPTNSHEFSQSRQRMQLVTGSTALVLRNSRGGESLCVPGHTSDEMCAVSCLVPAVPSYEDALSCLKTGKGELGTAGHVVSWKSRINSVDSMSPGFWWLMSDSYSVHLPGT